MLNLHQSTFLIHFYDTFDPYCLEDFIPVQRSQTQERNRDIACRPGLLLQGGVGGFEGYSWWRIHITPKYVKDRVTMDEIFPQIE